MENLKSYLDGELDLAQQTEVETHLRNDAELQQMVEEFRTISTTLKTAETGEPYGFDKLEERLAEKGKFTLIERKKLWRQAISWSASGFLVLLIAAVLFPVFAQSKSGATLAAKRAQMNEGYATETVSGATTASPQVESQLQDSSVEKPVSPPTEMSGKAFEGVDGFSSKQHTSEILEQDLAKSMPQSTQAREDGVLKGKAPSDERKFESSAKSVERTAGGLAANGVMRERAVEPESDFKSQMRFEANKSAQSVKGPRDTPQGIYLERAGETQVKVEDVGRAVNEATGMVQGLDGFVVNSNVQNRAEGGMATMTLRVPTKSFQTALERLEKMGERLSSNSSSQDITTEMVDNGTRMVSWADEEKRVMDALAKAKDENRKYYLRQELSQIRVNLEAYRAQVKSLKQRAEFSTINATFLSGDQADKPGAPSSNWSGSAYKGAKDSLSSVGQLVGVVGIYFLVFAPIWLPFVVVTLMIRKKSQS